MFENLVYSEKKSALNRSSKYWQQPDLKPWTGISIDVDQLEKS